MNKFVRVVITSLLISSGIFFSGCTNADSAVKNERPNTQEVLKKSVEEMKKLKGYKWQVTANQNLKASEPGVTATTNITGGVDYINEVNFRANMQMSAEFSQDQSRENIALELISKDNMVYLKNGYTNQWAKSQMTPEMTEHFLGLDQEYSNPEFILDKVLIDENETKINEQGDNYVVELSLTDPSKIKPYMEYALRNWEKDSTVKHDQVKFDSFKVSLHISKNDYKLNKIEQDAKANVPLNVANASIDMEQKMTLDFKGEVTSITVPADAESAPEVNLNPENNGTNGGSGGMDGAYRPGDIFKGIEGGINPNFGSDSYNSSGSSQTNDKPYVDPSFGSY